MYLWRKIAGSGWLRAHEDILQTRSRGRLAIISAPRRKRLQLEIACCSRSSARALIADLGGRAEKLPRDWLERFTHMAESKPLTVGKRLVVVRNRRSDSRNNASAAVMARSRRLANPSLLVIPASAAFGTGEHTTTAMSLRLLEQLSHPWKHGWSLVDLGTGSGIVALAAKCFGASRVLGIDNDPTAIEIAKSNARLNKIDRIRFRLGDVRTCKLGHEIDVVTANLYCDLLMEILPKLKRSSWLIVSGVLRDEEEEFLLALRRNGFAIVRVKRRGKWLAVLAKEAAHASRLPIGHADQRSSRV